MARVGLSVLQASENDGNVKKEVFEKAVGYQATK
jgi:hypothetical protein